MEEVQSQDQIAQQGPLQPSSFNQPKPKNNGSKWVIIFILLLIIGGAGIFFFSKSGSEPVATPTPSFGVVPIENKATPAATPTATPAAIKRDEVTIEIQNGTGITGEAKLLQDKLKTLGYSEITVGNAATTDNTETTVTFLKTLSQSVQDEIKKTLESFYKTVNVKISTTQKSDVIVLTGLRSGSTSASATPKSTAIASSSPKASATPTAKASSTPTPTGN